MKKDAPLRVGVVGTGAVAQLIHLPLLSERTDVQLVALADADEQRAGKLAERFEIPRVSGADALLRNEEVDAVILCTPNHLHEEMTLAALEDGKHVLVERPLALTPGGVDRIVAAAEENDRVVMTGMSHRFRPEVSALRSFTQSGELGRIYAARAAWMNRAVPMRRAGWRHRIAESGGGALMDLGVQALDLLFWILDHPRVVRVTAIASPGEYEVEDAASLQMETESGAALSVEVSWNFYGAEDRHYARVLGTEGGGELPPLEIHKKVGGRPIDVTPRAGTPLGHGKRYQRAFRREHDHFFRMIRGHASVELPREQRHLMEIVEAAYRSIEEGCEIRL